MADVRVGTCLSGGLDSSSIVCMIAALLREHSPHAASVGERLETFSAVFPGDPIDERPWIEAVLESSGARGNFVEPDSAQFIRELGDLVWSLDEPVVSSGPYAQWCVMRLAHGRVKVLLDGQGGDELLGGYVPYRFVYLRQLLRERRFGRLAREGLGRQELRMLARRFLPRPGRAAMSPQRYLRPAFVSGKALPRDLPPRSTVWDYLDRWEWDGTLARIHHALYVEVREQAGREASPTAAIIDSQSARGAPKGAQPLILRASMPGRRCWGASATS